uniref:Uncharacterized protein n=1 Tax=Bracon brevicornis TaxID=1563983 RepID=A0A6V7LT54_9HYME
MKWTKVGVSVLALTCLLAVVTAGSIDSTKSVEVTMRDEITKNNSIDVSSTNSSGSLDDDNNQGTTATTESIPISHGGIEEEEEGRSIIDGPVIRHRPCARGRVRVGDGTCKELIW